MAVENGVQNAELGYLLFPFEQYSNLAGKPLVGGHMEIFEAGTDTKYISYQNWDGAENPFKIPLPADGRITVLADPTKTFDCYLYDSYNNLVCSRLNVQCCVPGNISIKGADTILKNTDGTLDIYLRTLGNNVREYTVNTHNKILDVQEPLYFVENSNTATVIGISGGTVPEGTMNESALGYQDGQITGYNGSALGGNATLTLRTNGIKDGTYTTLGTYAPLSGSKNIDIPREVYTFTIGNNSCFYNDVIMAYLNSKVVVALEIESWYEDGQQKQNVYENFAQKQFWGDTNFYNGGYVNFVRVDVEKNQIVTWKCEPETPGSITGYAKWTKTVTDLGSGGLFIAEYGNPGTTYEEIDAAFNAGKTIIAHKKEDGSTIDQYYQLCEIRKNPELPANVDCYVFVHCYSFTVEELFRFQSNWSNLETTLATTAYVNQQISAGDFATHNDLSAYQTIAGMTAYQPSGDYATHDDLTAYQTVEGMSAYQPSGDYATHDDLTAYQPVGDYVTQDEMTGYQPSGDYVTQDEMTAYQPSGDYATHDDLTAYATTSLVSSISSELYSAVSSISGDYELVAGSGVELVDDPNAKTTTINVTAEGTPVTAIEQMIESATSGKADASGVVDYTDKPSANAIYASGNQFVINRYTNGSDVLINKSGMFLYNAGISASQAPAEYASTAPAVVFNTAGFSACAGRDELAPKIQLNALGLNLSGLAGQPSYYSAGVSTALGPYFINSGGTHVLSAKQDISGMSAYQAAGDYLSANALDNLSGTWETVTAKADADDLTAYQTIADMTAYATVESLTSKQDAGDYLSASESANYYPMTGNPAGFLTEHQSLDGYATTEDVESAVSSKLDTTAFSDVSGSFLTAHQDISNKLDTTAFSNISGNFLTAVPDTYLQNTNLTIVDNKITEISGVPLSAGDELPEVVSAAADYVSANSATINGTIDAVSSNSGVWGGSALPISAGPGIKFEMINDTLVFSNDETVLWEGTAFTPAGSENPMLATAPLSESITNFDKIRLDFSGGFFFAESVLLTHPITSNLCYLMVKKEQANNDTYIGTHYRFSDDTTLSGFCSYGSTQNVNAMTGGYWGYGGVYRVVGINRISGGN